MTFPNTDFPVSLDAQQTRVDLVDTVFGSDFNYQDTQIRRVQEYLGISAELIGQRISNRGPGGLVSPVSSGGIAIKLAARNVFAGGTLLSVGDAFDTAYDEKLSLSFDGILWTYGGADFSDAEYLRLPNVPNLPSSFEAGRLAWKLGVGAGLYVSDGSSWSTVGGGETNTVSNVGTGGIGLFLQKTGVDFEFRNIAAGSSNVSVTLDAPTNEVRIDVADSVETPDLVYDQIYWVDVANTDPSPDGSRVNPYTAIGDALTAIGNPADLADEEKNFLIYVVAGDYTESLTIPWGRNIHFCAVTNYYREYVRINGTITQNVDGTSEKGSGWYVIRFFSTDQIGESTGTGINRCFWANGYTTNIISSSASTFELFFDKVALSGNLTYGEAAWDGYLYYSHGLVTGISTVYGYIGILDQVQFNGNFTTEYYWLIKNCLFSGDLVVSTGLASWLPGNSGVVDCEFSGAGALTFPAANSYFNGVSVNNALADSRTVPADTVLIEKSVRAYDEGSSVGYYNKINFVGAGVTAADNAGTLDVTIAGGGTDANAIHDNVNAEISAITEKASPVSADLLIIEDSSGATYDKKKVQIGNLPFGIDEGAVTELMMATNG